MILSFDFIFIFAACVCLALLILNIGTRVNLLALALLLFFVTLLTGCATLQKPGPITTATGADLTSLAKQAADAYIKIKSGDADFAWSIAAGIRAYQTGIKTAGDFKTLIGQFSDGQKAGKSFVQNLAELYSSSEAPPEVTLAAMASAVETAAE